MQCAQSHRKTLFDLFDENARDDRLWLFVMAFRRVTLSVFQLACDYFTLSHDETEAICAEAIVNCQKKPLASCLSSVASSWRKQKRFDKCIDLPAHGTGHMFWGRVAVRIGTVYFNVRNWHGSSMFRTSFRNAEKSTVCSKLSGVCA